MGNDLVTRDFFGEKIEFVKGPDGKPWAVADSVAKVLGLKKIRDNLRRLLPTEKGVYIVDTLGGPQKKTIVNRDGLIKLIFTSRTERAHEPQNPVIVRRQLV